MKLNLRFPSYFLPVVAASAFLVSCATPNTYEVQRAALIQLVEEDERQNYIQKGSMGANAVMTAAKAETKTAEKTATSTKAASIELKKTDTDIKTTTTTENKSASGYKLDTLFGDYILWVVDHLSGLLFSPKTNNSTTTQKIQLITEDKMILDGGNLTVEKNHEHGHTHKNGETHEHDHDHHEGEEEVIVGRALSFANGLFLVVDLKEEKHEEKKEAKSEMSMNSKDMVMMTKTEMMSKEMKSEQKMEKKEEHEHHHKKLSLSTTAYKFGQSFNILEFTGAMHHKTAHNNETEFKNLGKKYGGMTEYTIVDFDFNPPKPTK